MKMKLIILMLIAVTCPVGIVAAQSGAADSISVDEAVNLTLRNHASIRKAEYDAMASKARIGVDRSDRYPDISLNGEYTRIGPVSKFDLPGQGSIAVAPYNNYNFYVDVRQTLYDFGRTENAIRLAESSSKSSTDNVELVKFNLAYRTIAVYQNILILHRQIDVLDEQLETLNRHLEMSVRKLKAGTATDFDTLTVRVRIAVARSSRIDATRALENSEIAFRELTGLGADIPINLSGDFVSSGVTLSRDSLIALALERRPEMLLARDAENTAATRAELVSRNDKPSLDIGVTTGFKNGYEPNLNTWRGNYVAGIRLKVPVFNGNRTKHRETAADAELSASRSHITDLERRIRSEVLQAIGDVTSNLDKIASTKIQMSQAEKAVSLARARYNAGVITNLDLLDAETTLSQTKLIHLRALYDYTASLNDLDRATGKQSW